MRCFLFMMSAFLGMSLSTVAQTVPGEPKALPLTSTLPANYPVITIPGLCPPGTKPSGAAKDACKTVVTRAEFERMVTAIDPAMPKYERQELAQQYGRNLILAQRAREIGFDKEPRIRELLRYSEIRILSSELQLKMFNEYSHFSPEELARFYQENKAVFQKFTVARIFIPREKQGAEGDNSAASSEAAMKTLAESVQARAAAGEDFDKLQQEVFQAAGMTGTANTRMTDVSRETLPDSHRQILELGAGSVSPLIPDANGYFVYKVVSAEVPPLASIQQQAELRLQRKKSFEALERVQKSAKPQVNNSYFEKYDPPKPREGEESEND